MRIENKVELCASKDLTRPNLTGVYLDVAKRRAVAMDGHMMAIVPADILDGEVSGLVGPEALKSIRKTGMHGDASKPDAIALPNGSTAPRARLDFPPYEQVIPSYKPGDHNTITIGLNADLLAKLQRAIGAETVTLTFPAKNGMLDPIVVNAGKEAFGVIMPCST